MSWKVVSEETLYDTGYRPRLVSQTRDRLQKPSDSTTVRERFPLRSKTRIIRVSQTILPVLAHGFRQLLSYEMVAQLLLAPHHPKIVIITGTEHALRQHLVLALPARHNPNNAPTRTEIEPANLTTRHEVQCLLGPFLESLVQNTLHLLRQCPGPVQVLADLLQYAGFPSIL